MGRREAQWLAVQVVVTVCVCLYSQAFELKVQINLCPRDLQYYVEQRVQNERQKPTKEEVRKMIDFCSF